MSVDYTKFKNKREQARAKRDAALNPSGRMDAGFWWKSGDADERAAQLVAGARVLEHNAVERSQANLRHTRLYGNSDTIGFNMRDYSRVVSVPWQKISLNVCASCSDTLAAKVAKTRPRPSFLTDGGSFRAQQSARRIDKFCRGLFYEMEIYEKAPSIFMDSLVFDIGAMKFYVNAEGKVCCERVFPEELFIDDADGIYGSPRQLLQRRLIQKEVLLADFADGGDKMLQAIEAAKPPPDAFHRGFGDCVEVWEGWHLRSGKKAGDGVHVIAIDGFELFSESWEMDCFPIAFLRFSERMLGFWGQGLVERLSGIQIEINRLLRSISEQLRRKGRGRIFLPIGSKVNPAHLTNGIADIVYFSGPTPPTVDTGNAVAQEEFAQLDRLYQRAFQEAGISELSAGAKKPSGLDAAVALREFSDIESERFALTGKRWEQFFMDAAEISLELVRTEKRYSVKLPSRRGTREVTWDDIKLQPDEYVMQMFPVSSLPQTPAYRLQRIGELRAQGFVKDMAEARRLMDFPDLESDANLETAALDDVDETISDILDYDKPVYTPPDEFTNLPLLAQRATAMYLRVKHMPDIEPERLSMLIRLVDQAKNLIQLAQPPPPPPAPPAPAPGPMMPPGGPMMTGGIQNSVQVSQPQPVAAPPLIAQ